MSLTSKINGTTKKDKQFKEILLSIEPQKEDFYNLSKKAPFSDEYDILVPSTLTNKDSSLVGTAFDYLARFRIAQFLKKEDVIQGWTAFYGFERLNFTEEHTNYKLFFKWVDKILEYINNNSKPITHLIEIAVHLAKLEQIVRIGMRKENVNIDYIFLETTSEEIIKELQNLMVVFEEKFMIKEIINKKSKVFFNPDFGISSALVSGADADIFIDGTLYDFKTTKNKVLNKKDNLQIVGYFLLNSLTNNVRDVLGIGSYFDMDIKKIAFYKARFGEVEYYDIDKYVTLENSRMQQLIREMARYFSKNPGNLRAKFLFDYDEIKDYLNEK